MRKKPWTRVCLQPWGSFPSPPSPPEVSPRAPFAGAGNRLHTTRWVALFDGYTSLQLYEHALRQHTASPTEAVASYERLLAQPIVAEAVADARLTDDGLALLQWLGADPQALRAYCLHPILQPEQRRRGVQLRPDTAQLVGTLDHGPIGGTPSPVAGCLALARRAPRTGNTPVLP